MGAQFAVEICRALLRRDNKEVARGARVVWSAWKRTPNVIVVIEEDTRKRVRDCLDDEDSDLRKRICEKIALLFHCLLKMIGTTTFELSLEQLWHDLAQLWHDLEQLWNNFCIAREKGFCGHWSKTLLFLIDGIALGGGDKDGVVDMLKSNATSRRFIRSRSTSPAHGSK